MFKVRKVIAEIFSIVGAIRQQCTPELAFRRAPPQFQNPAIAIPGLVRSVCPTMSSSATPSRNLLEDSDPRRALRGNSYLARISLQSLRTFYDSFSMIHPDAPSFTMRAPVPARFSISSLGHAHI